MTPDLAPENPIVLDWSFRSGISTACVLPHRGSAPPVASRATGRTAAENLATPFDGRAPLDRVG